MRKIFLLLLVFLGFFSIYLTNLAKPNQRTVAGIKTSASETTVSLSIGEFHFTLFGYTSPSAKVTISGLGIFDETYADEIGYFIFNNRFSPFSPREACLTAQDVLGRLSAPLCLPPFPTIYNVEIGPVIMPPTVSVDIGEYFIGDEAMLSGQTIPNTEVDLAFFTDQIAPMKKRLFTDNQGAAGIKGLGVLNSVSNDPAVAGCGSERVWDCFEIRPTTFSFIKPVEAYSFPQLQTKSDEKGNFSISVPTSQPMALRAFAQAAFKNSLSPKSLTLNMKILPWWMIVLRMFGLMFDLLKKHWLEIGLLMEFIILLMILIENFFHPHRLAKTRAIVLRESFALIKR
jgi:hypothetical protein